MSTLKVPGAQLFYEVSGDGPLLILIPGARGDGEVFRPVACDLSARYQVVTYDRRGFSRSHLDGPQGYEHRLATDADDVRRLIEHLTDQPATVFGNSSGAIVALEVLIHAPERVQTVVAHEPPAVLLLPDAAYWLAFFDGIYDTYLKEGVPAAMHQFASGAFGSVDHQLMEHAMREHANEYTLSNITYWMEHELRQYPRVELDLALRWLQTPSGLCLPEDVTPTTRWHTNRTSCSLRSWASISSIYPADISASWPLPPNLHRNS